MGDNRRSWSPRPRNRPPHQPTTAGRAGHDRGDREETTDQRSRNRRSHNRTSPKKPDKPVKVKEPTVSPSDLQRALESLGPDKAVAEARAIRNRPAMWAGPTASPAAMGWVPERDGAFTDRVGREPGRAHDQKAPGASATRPSEAGKVVLDIWVDREGKVMRAARNLDKSTTTSQSLVDIAKRARMEMHLLPPSPNAARSRRAR